VVIQVELIPGHYQNALLFPEAVDELGGVDLEMIAEDGKGPRARWDHIKKVALFFEPRFDDR